MLYVFMSGVPEMALRPRLFLSEADSSHVQPAQITPSQTGSQAAKPAVCIQSRAVKIHDRHALHNTTPLILSDKFYIHKLLKCYMIKKFNSERKKKSMFVSNRGSKIVIQTELWVWCVVTALIQSVSNPNKTQRRLRTYSTAESAIWTNNLTA